VRSVRAIGHVRRVPSRPRLNVFFSRYPISILGISNGLFVQRAASSRLPTGGWGPSHERFGFEIRRAQISGTLRAVPGNRRWTKRIRTVQNDAADYVPGPIRARRDVTRVPLTGRLSRRIMSERCGRHDFVPYNKRAYEHERDERDVLVKNGPPFSCYKRIIFVGDSAADGQTERVRRRGTDGANEFGGGARCRPTANIRET